MSVDVGLAVKIGVLEGFLEVVEAAHKESPEITTSRLILVLGVYRWHLRRRHKGSMKALPLEHLDMVKTAIRNAESILHDLREEHAEEMAGWHLGCNPANRSQQFANALWRIVMDLTIEVQENERLYPELKPVFDRERKQYRKRLGESQEA